jgi:uncharacterized protein
VTSIPPRDLTREQNAKERVRDAFRAWATGTGTPFDLAADDVVWTIVGRSPVSGTYRSKQEFLDAVITPFMARMSTSFVPTVRGIYADGDWVIILFDAHASGTGGEPYENTYSWYMRFAGDGATPMIVEAIAFFDTIEFTEFWAKAGPA